jgi:hypothetical protein
MGVTVLRSQDSGVTKEGRFGRVQAASEEIHSGFLHVLTKRFAILDRRESVIIGDEIIGLALILETNGRLHHSKVVPDMKGPAGLDA